MIQNRQERINHEEFSASPKVLIEHKT